MSQPDPADGVAVEISVLTETAYGSEVRVVGTSGVLGAWCPEDGLRLATSSENYPKWSGKVPLPQGELPEEDLEYKFVVIDPNGTVTWEDCSNRHLVLGAGGTKLPTPWFGEPPPPCEVDDIFFEAFVPDTEPGDSVIVVGSAESLGAWDAAAGLRLTTDPASFPWWTGEVQIPDSAVPFSWKLAIVRADGSLLWESVHPNRRATPPHGGADRWSVRVHFDGVSAAPVPRPPTSTGPPKRFMRPQGTIKTSDSLPELRLATHMSMPAISVIDTSPIKAAASMLMTPAAPRPDEQLLILREEDVGPETLPAEAEVAVVFEADEKVLCPMRPDKEKSGWSLRFSETGQSPAVHTFYFLVDGRRVLSSAYQKLLGAPVNVALMSDSLQRYLLVRNTNPELTPEVVDSLCDEVLPVRLLASTRSCIQSWSHAGAQGTSLEEDVTGQAAREKPVAFPSHVLEGLYDGNLRLRLSGHAVPAGLPPPTKLWAGARRLKKACSTVCEDACFFGDHALGVADGVGGMSSFASEGVDAAAYAMELLHHCSQWLERHPEEREAGNVEDPEKRAVSAVRAAELAVKSYGASTMVLAIMEGSTLGVANLGDSGFLVLRKRPNGMTIVAQSVDQQHGYNTPYQLMRLPQELVTRRRLCIRHIDTAADCQTYRFGLRSGDLVLLFSDGLRDNLHDREILHIVDRALDPALAGLAGLPDSVTPPEIVAKALAAAAKIRSVDPAAQVPFVEYSKMHGQITSGGKADDITVVAAWAVP